MSEMKPCKCGHPRDAHSSRKVGYHIRIVCNATVTATEYSYLCPCDDYIGSSEPSASERITQLTQDLAVARRDRDLLQTMVNAQASRYAEVEASLAVAIEETRRAWNRIFKDNPELQVNRVSLAMVDDIVAILSREGGDADS